MSSLKRQYLLIDQKRFRRNSAPESLAAVASSADGSGVNDRFRARASLADISVLLEDHSGSGSSLEIDTSNVSRDTTPVPNYDSSPCRGSYQNIAPLINFELYRRNSTNDSFLTLLCSWSIAKTILITQMMAVCLAVMELSNEYLRDLPHDFFTIGQNLPHYFLLSLVWTTQLAWRDEGRGIVAVAKLSGLRYVLLAAIHVEANYLLLSSFQHPSYIGNQLTDCVAACLSIVLAYVCLEVRMHLTHSAGFLLAMVGAIGLCAANVLYKRDGEPDHVTWGDILRIVSGLFLAFNSLAQELIVKSIDSVEYLGMVGFLGSLICGLQSITAEWHQAVPTRLDYWLAVSGFGACQFLFSCLAPKVLRDTGTIGMHLALITAAFYTHLAAAFMGREKMELLYVASFAVVLIGSYLFTVRRTSITQHFFFPVKVIISKSG